MTTKPTPRKPDTEAEVEYQALSVWELFYSATKFQTADRSRLARVAKMCHLDLVETDKAILEFEKWAESRSFTSPNTDILLVLVEFNVFRALVSNGRVLGISVHDNLDDDALSPFADHNYSHITTVPIALRPTKLQRDLPHHPWIDLLPIPAMRDNLLRAGDTYDDVRVCADFVGFGSTSSSRTGVIIWGEPWDPAGWEVTSEFLKNWGWTLQGCNQLLQATNYWRGLRGEKPLELERVLCEEARE